MKRRLETLLPCAVCFGAGDNPKLPLAFSWGIFLMMGLTFLILGTFVVSVMRMEARRNAPPK
jgi:hypothetical protein